MKINQEGEVMVPVGKLMLPGNLTIPKESKSLVIFSHGSGSGRFSPRNQYVAKVLNKEKIATLLIDLLTLEEDEIYENRFNIDLLTQRLVIVTKWLWELPDFRKFRTGYFGASTGAASALKAAAILRNDIDAVVSRGGRPDLAENSLRLVKAPTLFLVGGLDYQIFEINQHAFEQMYCEKKLEYVQGATHLFEEPGKLEEVAELAAEWFRKHLTPGRSGKMVKERLANH